MQQNQLQHQNVTGQNFFLQPLSTNPSSVEKDGQLLANSSNQIISINNQSNEFSDDSTHSFNENQI